MDKYTRAAARYKADISTPCKETQARCRGQRHRMHQAAESTSMWECFEPKHTQHERTACLCQEGMRLFETVCQANDMGVRKHQPHGSSLLVIVAI